MGDITHRFEVWYAGSREGRYVFDDTSQAMREELRPFGIAFTRKRVNVCQTSYQQILCDVAGSPTLAVETIRLVGEIYTLSPAPCWVTEVSSAE